MLHEELHRKKKELADARPIGARIDNALAQLRKAESTRMRCADNLADAKKACEAAAKQEVAKRNLLEDLRRAAAEATKDDTKTESGSSTPRGLG